MKIIIALVFALIQMISFGQDKISPTDKILITGEVENEITISISDLLKLKPVKIEDVVITNHLGEKKSTASKLSGVPIKDIFKSVQFKEGNPKLLSTFYLVFVASDGYQVVYSWNEIFNTATGDNTFILVQKNEKQINEMEDRLVVVTKTDFKTGRRFIKGLSKIIVHRVP